MLTHPSTKYFALAGIILFLLQVNLQAKEPIVLDLWPELPPGETGNLAPEHDSSGEEGRMVAGKRVTRLTNVSTPQIAVYQPEEAKANGAAVVICPGGGHRILAYDLEGIEVAEWLNSLGVTGIVLKYRVPARDPEKRWTAAVQDAQRAMSLVRSKAKDWNLDPDRIGICGFSAGGQTAGLTSLFLEDRQYQAIDAVDQNPIRPSFTMLIYPAYLVERSEPTKLAEEVKVTKDVPPMFFVHAFDDRISVNNSLLVASALKGVDVPIELHVYPTGKHGYGLRPTEEPVTHWPERAAIWLEKMGFLASE
ncbi:Acetylxylan esterase [Planctomycetales bacterium 10988]|nr:Acetylxylan esterase [Planctomycetales bacterium 10988]